MATKRRAAGPAAKRKPQRPASARTRFLKVLKAGGIGALVLAVIGVGGFLVLYQTIDIPEPNDAFQTETSHIYYADGKTELGQFATQDRDSVPLPEMSKHIKNAVVAAENQSFWTDNGIDPKGIIRAAFSNAQGNATQGASTITQQYVKILYLSQEQTYKRKIKEAILSLKIQRQLSKEEILEGYLNTIYFGRGAYGIEAAAEAFFGKSAKKLNLRQSAVLASVLNNPTRFDPANGKEARAELKGRYDYVLGNMAELDQISSEQAEKAKRKLPHFPEVDAEDTYGGQRGHMLAMIRDELLRLGFTEEEIDGGGLEVTTTFTEKHMAAAKQGVLEARPQGLSDKELHVGAASVEPGTGAVLGFYAGQDYLQSQLNWAVEGGQAGSTFKAFAVAAAIKAGFSLKDTFDGNSPYDLGGGEDVENQGNRDYGSAVSLLTATENSINTAFIDLTLAMEDGPEKIIKTANLMGIPGANGKRQFHAFPTRTPGLEPVTGVALGSQTVSPINMANGYATIAAGGEAAEPYIIEKVVDRYGKLRYEHEVQTERAMSEDIAADVSYALQQVVQSGSGTAALALGRPAAGKTGTATKAGGDVSSSWFVGYTPQLSTAVMYVRGEGNGTLDGYLVPFFGGSYPAETWTAIMQRAMEGVEVEDFPEPVFVDGEAPEDGHAPYVPPPPPPTKKQPPKQPTRTPDQPETSAPPTTQPPTSQPPTTQPPPPNPSDCQFLKTCPTGEPTPTNETSAPGNGNNGKGDGKGDGKGNKGNNRPADGRLAATRD